MNSEKVKEIKKALECCQGKNPNCTDCSYWDTCKKDYSVKIRSEILTLINELESENEKLTTENVNYYGAREQTIEELAEIITKQKDRIVVLENMCQGVPLAIETLKLNIVLKLKQFTERLKDNPKIKKIVDEGWIVSYVELCNAVDETLKEFING